MLIISGIWWVLAAAWVQYWQPKSHKTEPIRIKTEHQITTYIAATATTVVVDATTPPCGRPKCFTSIVWFRFWTHLLSRQSFSWFQHFTFGFLVSHFSLQGSFVSCIINSMLNACFFSLSLHFRFFFIFFSISIWHSLLYRFTQFPFHSAVHFGISMRTVLNINYLDLWPICFCLEYVLVDLFVYLQSS